MPFNMPVMSIVVHSWYLHVEMRLVKAHAFTTPQNLMIECMTCTTYAVVLQKRATPFRANLLHACMLPFIAQNDITLKLNVKLRELLMRETGQPDDRHARLCQMRFSKSWHHITA